MNTNETRMSELLSQEQLIEARQLMAQALLLFEEMQEHVYTHGECYCSICGKESKSLDSWEELSDLEHNADCTWLRMAKVIGGRA